MKVEESLKWMEFLDSVQHRYGDTKKEVTIHFAAGSRGTQCSMADCG